MLFLAANFINSSSCIFSTLILAYFLIYSRDALRPSRPVARPKSGVSSLVFKKEKEEKAEEKLGEVKEKLKEAEEEIIDQMAEIEQAEKEKKDEINK